MPKYPKISLKKKTSWCLKMGYTGIPFQTIENGLFLLGGPFYSGILGEMLVTHYSMPCRPVPSHASKVRVAWLGGFQMSLLQLLHLRLA